MQTESFSDFASFYKFYLSQHRNRTCRRLHFIGLISSGITLVLISIYQAWLYLPCILLFGYGFAWIGHFFFEKNKPATFSYPLLSLRGDFTLFRDILFGVIKF